MNHVPNKAKTHCPMGHPYDDANTLYNRAGFRLCRRCAAFRRHGWKSNHDDVPEWWAREDPKDDDSEYIRYIELDVPIVREAYEREYGGLEDDVQVEDFMSLPVPYP